nr:flavodoxin family protein [uncultured Agathobaculum sp.]
MKVLAINSSARKDGNTAILLERVLKELRKEGIATELIQLAGQIIEPCKACWTCGGQGNCVHRKDQFREIFDKMKEADGILLGSPVYSANISANMQALLERAAVVGDMNPGLLTHKVGAAVTAVRRGGALNAVDAMNHFFLNHEMIVVGSTYWNMAYGQLPGDVEKDAEGLANMANLGKNMAWLLKALNGIS